MKIESINSRKLFGDFYPRANDKVPEGLEFFAGIALTLWAPTILACYVIGQVLPAYLMFCDETLGVLLGIIMYKSSASDLLSCVPVGNVPDVASSSDQSKLKKAA